MASGTVEDRPPFQGNTARGRRLPRPVLAAAGAAFAAALWCAAAGGDGALVTVPLFTALGVGAFFLAAVIGRGGGSEAFLELGPIYAAAVTLYTVYPLAGYLANGMRYTALNDNRLFVLQPAPADIGAIAWLYVAHLAGFTAVYALARGRTGSVTLNTARMSRVAAVVLLLLLAGIELFHAVVAERFGWHFETNLDRYVAYANLPLFLAQVIGHLGPIRLVLVLALLAYLFARPGSPHWVVLPWLALVGWSTWQKHQSRVELVLALIGAAICFHLIVRPFRAGFLVPAAAAALAGFILFGASRDRPGAAALGVAERLLVANEFETLFANAVELSDRAAAGDPERLPPGFFLSDLLAAVPQQLLSDPKVSPPTWFVQTFHPGDAARGVGYCFGTISESVVGGRLPDALLRGAALGLLFGALHRFVARRRREHLWWFVFYVWTAALSYNAFRSTTFHLLARVVFEFLPVVALASGVGWLLAAARRGLGRAPSHAAPGTVRSS